MIAELTGDNRPDIYVANDGTPCWLFANQGNLRFEEIGEEAGVARDGQGQALAGMGVAAGDLDGDGLCDLVVTNFFDRSTVAFQPLADQAASVSRRVGRLGLAAATRDVLGFGLALVDFDGDGRIDLMQANGHVLDRARLGIPFAMRPTLLRNTGGRFEDIARSAGPWFDAADPGPRAGRRRPGRRRPARRRRQFARRAGGCVAKRRPKAIISWLSTSSTRPAGRRWVPGSSQGRGAPAGERRHGGRQLSCVRAQPDCCSGWAQRESVERIEVTWPWGISESWSDAEVPVRGMRLSDQAGERTSGSR